MLGFFKTLFSFQKTWTKEWSSKPIEIKIGRRAKKAESIPAAVAEEQSAVQDDDAPAVMVTASSVEGVDKAAKFKGNPFSDGVLLGEHHSSDGSICHEYQCGPTLVYIAFEADARYMPAHEQIARQFGEDLQRQDEVCKVAMAFFMNEHSELKAVVESLPADERDLFSVYSLHYPRPSECEWKAPHGIAVTYVCGLNHDYFNHERFNDEPLYDELYDAVESGYIDVEHRDGTLNAY